jgi:N-glycosylase/DNA lyase
MGGQSFSWDFDEKEETYWGVTQDKVIEIKKLTSKNPDSLEILWQTYPKQDDFEFIKRYLRLDDKFDEILSTIKKDIHINTSIEKYPGLRLLQQDFEQTLLSFILSSNKNIPAIRKSIRDINKKYGGRLKVKKKEFYLFPRTERFIEASHEDLLETKIGYRAKYIKSTAEMLLKESIVSKIENQSEENTRSILTQLHGVGDKVADCTMVFSLNFDNITPLDVWAKKVFIDLYKLDPKMKYEDMRRWVDRYFEGKAAWAGQFLFEYIRTEKK